MGFLTDARYSKGSLYSSSIGDGSWSYLLLLQLKFLADAICDLVFAVFNAPAIPLLDSIALDAVDRAKSYYGNVRMFGSLGYAVSASLMPYLYNHLQTQEAFSCSGCFFATCPIYVLSDAQRRHRRKARCFEKL